MGVGIDGSACGDDCAPPAREGDAMIRPLRRGHGGLALLLWLLLPLIAAALGGRP
jgi:hypothetical protein